VRLTPVKLVVVMVMVVGLVAMPAFAAHASDDGCGVKHDQSGACTSGSIGGGAVDVRARARDQPSRLTAPVPDGPNSPIGDPQRPVPAVLHPMPRHDRLAADVDVPCTPGIGTCFDGRHAFLPPAKAPVKPADPAPTAPAAPAVSLEDVAGFVPRTASIRSQPNGWALVGAPVNLLTDAAPQVVDGTLLGRPAQVRFVPVAFTWDHGDGTSATVEGPGASWRDLGQHDFTATRTSHVYDAMGDRQITLTIAYSPSYRFDGGGWQQIAGTLPVQVGPVTIHVLKGSTVLVGGVCGSPDEGPGC
jgi:hypothetical protein